MCPYKEEECNGPTYVCDKCQEDKEYVGKEMDLTV